MRSNDPGRLSSCLGTRYQAVSHLLPIARRVSPCLLGRGSTRRARTVSPYRHRAPRQRAYDFLPARPPSPRFRTGETVSMLPTDDCFPTLVGEHSRLVRFRVARATGRTWRFTTSGTLRRIGGGARGVFVPLIRYRKSHLTTTEPLAPPSRHRIRLAPLSSSRTTIHPASPRPVPPPLREKRRLLRSEASSLVR